MESVVFCESFFIGYFLINPLPADQDNSRF